MVLNPVKGSEPCRAGAIIKVPLSFSARMICFIKAQSISNTVSEPKDDCIRAEPEPLTGKKKREAGYQSCFLSVFSIQTEPHESRLQRIG